MNGVTTSYRAAPYNVTAHISARQSVIECFYDKLDKHSDSLDRPEVQTLCICDVFIESQTYYIFLYQHMIRLKPITGWVLSVSH